MDNTELFKIKTQWEKHNWQEQTKSNATKKQQLQETTCV